MDTLKPSRGKKHKKLSNYMKSSSNQKFKVQSRIISEAPGSTLLPPHQKINHRAASSKIQSKYFPSETLINLIKPKNLKKSMEF